MIEFAKDMRFVRGFEKALVLPVKRTREDAILPTRAHETDAGLDLYTPERVTIWPGEFAVIPTGIAVELPTESYGQILGRSSLAIRGVFPIGGVIDAGYRGEIKVALVNAGKEPAHFDPGHKVAQLVIIRIETPRPIEVAELDGGDRGVKGFGSSGK